MRNALSRKTIALAGLLLAGAAQAQQTGTPQAPPPTEPTMQGMPSHTDVPSFDSLDKAHRGYLKRGDIPAGVGSLQQLRAHFAEADRDGNGRITPDEYAAYIHQTPGSSQP